MAIRNSGKKFFSDFRQGVILHSDSDFVPVNLTAGQLLTCQNLYWRSGLQKRKGMIKLSTNRISTTDALRALHRFYRVGDTAQLLAASGAIIAQYDSIATTWSAIKTGLNTDADTFFTSYSPTEKVLIANGFDTPMVWDGTTMSDYTVAPAGAKQFIVHRERVFTYISGLTISYSDNLDPDTWSAASLILASDDPNITAMIKHTQNTADTSVVSQLLIFTDNTTWVLAGNDFVSLDDVFLQEISGQIGTSSPNTVVKTPNGVVFFGRQNGRNNVFLVIGEGLGARIIPIGDNIRQALAEVPSSALDEATATYYDGYYRLIVRPAGQIANTREWWLRMDNISQNNISWFGPMKRDIGLRSIVNLSGSGDNNIIYGGGETGFLYWLERSFDDDSTTIDVKLQTAFDDYGFPSQEKTIDKVFINVHGSGGSLIVKINMDLQAVSAEVSKSVTLTTVGGGFPYTFPITFPTPGINLKTVDFMQDKPQGILNSLKIEFSEANKNLLFNSIGVRYIVNEEDKRED